MPVFVSTSDPFCDVKTYVMLRVMLPCRPLSLVWTLQLHGLSPSHRRGFKKSFSTHSMDAQSLLNVYPNTDQLIAFTPCQYQQLRVGIIGELRAVCGVKPLLSTWPPGHHRLSVKHMCPSSIPKTHACLARVHLLTCSPNTTEGKGCVCLLYTISN